MNSSIAERSTKIRERAQQSWPALPKTAPGAAAAAASMSASAKTTLADLPPSSSVTRLIVPAAPSAIPRPTSVEPVKAILATSGCSTSRLPQTEPGPATTLRTPSGSPDSSAMRSSSIALSGVSSAGLRTIVLPAASAGATFQEAITSGKFQGTISPTTPSGSRNVMSTPPATGIVCPATAPAPRRNSGSTRRPCRSRRARRRRACRRCGPRGGSGPPPRARCRRRPTEDRASARRAGRRARPGRQPSPPRRRVDVLDAGARDLVERELGRRLDDRERAVAHRALTAVRAASTSEPMTLDLTSSSDARGPRARRGDRGARAPRRRRRGRSGP